MSEPHVLRLETLLLLLGPVQLSGDVPALGQLLLQRALDDGDVIIILIIIIIIIITWMMAMSSLMPEMSGEQNWPEPPEQSKEKLY